MFRFAMTPKVDNDTSVLGTARWQTGYVVSGWKDVCYTIYDACFRETNEVAENVGTIVGETSLNFYKPTPAL